MCRFRFARALLAAAGISALAAPGMTQHLAEAVDGGDNAAYASLPTASEPAEMLDVVPADPPTEPCVTCGSCIECGDACRGESFWFGSVELTALNPHFSSPHFALPAFLTVDDDDASVGPRFNIGWESANNLGFRARFWEYSDDFDLTTADFTPFTWTLKAARFDFDVYHRFKFRSASLAVGAAVSSADVRMNYPDFSRAAEEMGGGASFFLEARHAFYQSTVSEWAVIARGRLAELMGEWEDEQNFAPNLQKADSTMEIGEAALGVEYRRKMRRTDLVVQYMLEAQRWDTTYVGDVGFVGSAMSIGFSR